MTWTIVRFKKQKKQIQWNNNWYQYVDLFNNFIEKENFSKKEKKNQSENVGEDEDVDVEMLKMILMNARVND